MADALCSKDSLQVPIIESTEPSIIGIIAFICLVIGSIFYCRVFITTSTVSTVMQVDPEAHHVALIDDAASAFNEITVGRSLCAVVFNAAVYSPVDSGRVVFSSIFVALGLFVEVVYAVDISTAGYKLFSSSIFLHLISVVFGCASVVIAIVSYSSSGSTSGLLERALFNGQACVCYAIASGGQHGSACCHRKLAPLLG